MYFISDIEYNYIFTSNDCSPTLLLEFFPHDYESNFAAGIFPAHSHFSTIGISHNLTKASMSH